jgi:hypothetical protein
LQTGLSSPNLGIHCSRMDSRLGRVWQLENKGYRRMAATHIDLVVRRLNPKLERMPM